MHAESLAFCLPRYFKPLPRCIIDEALETCTLQFPNSCPLQSVSVKGNRRILKHLACLEACKKLHEKGALTDSLVPDIVVEEGLSKEIGIFCFTLHPCVFACEHVFGGTLIPPMSYNNWAFLMQSVNLIMITKQDTSLQNLSVMVQHLHRTCTTAT